MNDSPETLHNRSHEQLKQYWNSLRGNRALPREDEIDSDDIADIWPSCFLISMDAVTQRMGYRYSYLGRDLIEALGEEACVRDASQRLVSPANTRMTNKFNEVVSSSAPVVDESEFINGRRERIKYRMSMVPLGGADGTVTHILGCMRWRAYAAPHTSPEYTD